MTVSMMRFRLIYIVILLFLSVSLSAERITLRSGKQLTGAIVAQSESILLLETPQGKRFQIPLDDILTIEQNVAAEDLPADTLKANSTRPIAFRIAVSGGLSAVSGEKCGGMTIAELQIGSHRIAGKDIFLGGSIGYAGAFLRPIAHYIPLQVVVAIPVPLISSSLWRAEMDASMGYAFGTKGHRGGLTGSLSAGARWAFSDTNHLFAGITAQFIQTDRERTEQVNHIPYTHSVGTAIWLIGAKIALQF